jgi:hypothetical protein
MAFLGTFIFISTLVASFLIPQQPDPQIMKALDDIQRTANQTLELVGRVKDELDIIQNTLKDIDNKLDKVACGDSINALKSPRSFIDPLYDKYFSTLLPQVQLYASAGVELPQSTIDDVDGWVTEVIEGMEVKMNLTLSLLAGTDDDGDTTKSLTAIETCGRNFANNAIAKKQATNKKNQTLTQPPFDDRLVYDQIQKFTTVYLNVAHRAATALTEAHSWQAQKRYNTALRNYVASSCSGNITLCPTFGTIDMPLSLGEVCARVKANPVSSLPYKEAGDDCKEIDRIASRVRDATLRTMELLGSPHSWGDTPGEGVRLVLGTDVLAPNTTNPLPDYTKYSAWLVPASPGAFDPACTFPNATAEAGCSLVGDFDDTTGATWAHLYYPLGIDAKLWQATPFPWLIMR